MCRTIPPRRVGVYDVVFLLGGVVVVGCGIGDDVGTVDVAFSGISAVVGCIIAFVIGGYNANNNSSPLRDKLSRS